MIDRTQFVPAGAPVDVPFPFGSEQTVPTEAFADSILKHIPEGCTVLEVGAGSGYLAACLAEKASRVVAIEINTLPYGTFHHAPDNVTPIHADGCNYDTGEQFDRIVVSFASPRIMHAWFTQLKPGGQLLVPISSHHVCRFCLYEKTIKAPSGYELILKDVLFYAPFTKLVESKPLSVK